MSGWPVPRRTVRRIWCRCPRLGLARATTTDTQSPALHVADSHELIRVQGARVNNLKDVSVEIPKRRLTVFTGVSGSGKSSLVFGTIAADSQRLINETYSAWVQGFVPTLARPEVDVLEGLTTAIIVDQQRMGAHARSTVGTATDANAMLRILFSRLGQPHIGSPNAFSLNVASVRASGAITIERGAGKTVRQTFTRTGGMCPRCEGRGSVTDFDLSQLYDDSKSLGEGALTIPGHSVDGWYGRIFSGSGFLDPDKPIGKYTKTELHDLLHKGPTKIKVDNINLTYEGLIPRIQKSFLSKDVDELQPHVRAFVERAVTFTACRECSGTRLSEPARSSRIGGINIADACAMQISDLAEWVRGVDKPSVAPLLRTLGEILDSFVAIGLGYLSLDRPSGTLSGGEAQRVKMIRHLGSSLTDVTYVFDEPTVGLHPHDIQRMNDLLLRLRDKATRCSSWSPSRRRSRSPTTSSTSAPAPVRRAVPSASRAPSRGCGPAAPSPAAISTTGPPTRRRCGRPPARWRSAARDGATRRRTPDCSTRSARRSRLPTA
jgi:excinuclease UvrABC ATPase subunit